MLDRKDYRNYENDIQKFSSDILRFGSVKRVPRITRTSSGFLRLNFVPQQKRVVEWNDNLQYKDSSSRCILSR